MAKDRLSGKLAVILHADVAGSSALVQQDKELAHERIQDSFQRFSNTIEKYHGLVLELRGDALLAEFDRAADAVTAALSFQANQAICNDQFTDDLRPSVRAGIAMGEVVIADNTVTGAGVVQAQRVEQLAEPGGVCITAAIHEALSKHLPLEFGNLGEQVLKGLDHPVHVHRVALLPGESIPPSDEGRLRDRPRQTRGLTIAVILVALVLAGGTAYWFKSKMPQVEAASVELMAFPLPDKPSIAVLPFNNMSDDVEQDYFADGMTEDLITDISKVSGLFVIARNSVFTYKGKAVKVRQVAEELGVRYVMEGSVRRAGNQVRVNAQLIDATTGGHIWAERYDGSLDDVFSMQDKITQNIVKALALVLTGQDQEKLAQVETMNPEAYDAFLRGWERYRQGAPEDLVKAAAFFKEAIQIDPDYARAYSALAAVYWNITLNGWSNRLDLLNSESWQQTRNQTREQTRLSLKKAMERPSALTHQIASERFAYLQRKPDRALAEAERAITLDTNDPAGHLAMAAALIKADRASEAAESVRTAMRLDPYYPASYLTLLGEAQFSMGEYDNAAASLDEAARRNPDNDWNFVYLAATYGQLGRKKEAVRAVEKANELRARSAWGALTIGIVGNYRQLGLIRGYYFKWYGDYKPLRDGLRKAGVPPDVNWRSLVSTGASGTEIKGATSIDAKTARKLHEHGVPFVDIWTTWRQKRIPGSTMLSLLYLGFNEVTLPGIVGKNDEFVIYGSGDTEGYGRWAPQAVARAVLWGYENVYYFEDGLEEWEAAGYPIVTESQFSSE